MHTLTCIQLLKLDSTSKLHKKTTSLLCEGHHDVIASFYWMRVPQKEGAPRHKDEAAPSVCVCSTYIKSIFSQIYINYRR